MEQKTTHTSRKQTRLQQLVGQVLTHQLGPRLQNRFEQRDDVVVFTSDKLKTSLEVCGYINLVLYSKQQKPHRFCWTMCCVFENGTSINICDGMMRISPEKISGTNKSCVIVGGKEQWGNDVLRLNIEIESLHLLFNQDNVYTFTNLFRCAQSLAKKLWHKRAH